MTIILIPVHSYNAKVLGHLKNVHACNLCQEALAAL